MENILLAFFVGSPALFFAVEYAAETLTIKGKINEPRDYT